MNDLNTLYNSITQLHNYFQSKIQREINNAFTIRNWLIGCYIVEYEQNGQDRAEYGAKTLTHLSDKFKKNKLKGFSNRNLRLFRQFYLNYPEIWQS